MLAEALRKRRDPRNRLPAPKIKAEIVTQKGIVTVSSDDRLMVPIQVNYSAMFELSITSVLDGTKAFGLFRPSKARTLQEDTATTDCREGEECDAASKTFTWSITQHDPQNVKIKLDMDKPDSISYTRYGRDQINLQIL